MADASMKCPDPGPAACQEPLSKGRWRRIGPLLRWIEHGLAALALLWILAVTTPFTTWFFNSLDRQGELQPAKYILCLGGDPSRVIESVRLLKEGRAPAMVVSNNGDAVRMMRDLAIEWGAPPDKVLVDDQAWKTIDHPTSIRRRTGLDPAQDTCIIVTNYTHLARSKACFEKAGYRHVIMREPRWEREFRRGDSGCLMRFFVLPKLIYESAAWCEYWLRGAV